MKSAGQILCPGMSIEAKIYSPAETQHYFSDSSSGNPSLRGSESSDVLNSSRVAISGAFRAWDTKICPENFWHSVTVFQSIQDFIESQTLKMEVEAQSIQNGEDTNLVFWIFPQPIRDFCHLNLQVDPCSFLRSNLLKNYLTLNHNFVVWGHVLCLKCVFSYLEK